MEEVNLKIEDFEDKKTQGGKRYTRFKTSDGWMSSFEKEVNEKLKDTVGKVVRLTIDVTDKDKGWKNIKAFHGVVADELMKVAQGEYKVKDQSRAGSMYTSYAKDIYIAMLEAAVKVKAEVEYEKVMTICINLVKQAQEAFE